jgi:hypothetical protein
MGFDNAYDDIDPLPKSTLGGLEHGERFSHSGRHSKKNAQFTAAFCPLGFLEGA